MIHAHDIQAKIAALVRDEISSADFARWIVSNSWNMHRDSSPEDIALASDVHLLLAERNDLSLSDADFRGELASLLPVSPSRVWMAVSANVPVKVSINIGPEPVADIKSFATPPRHWLVPVLAQL